MAELKQRPYTDEEAKQLLKEVMSEETTEWHYHGHHQGYVNSLNKIRDELKTSDRSKSSANYSEYSELKRRESFNHGAVILHEIYWENLGGDGNADESLEVVQQINKDFGSFDKFIQELKACGAGAKNSGWAVVLKDTLGDGKLHCAIVDFHNIGAWWGAMPIIALDVFEHAFYHKDGPKRGKFIEAFINNLHWGRINERWKKYC